MNIIKALCVIAGGFILGITFTLGMATLGEGYNVFNPYADTEFAPKYTPEKFTYIKKGMTEKEIRSILGEPITAYHDSSKTTDAAFSYYYTRDGYLMNHKKFSLAGDQAWYGSSVEFNKDSIAIRIFAGWYYD